MGLRPSWAPVHTVWVYVCFCYNHLRMCVCVIGLNTGCVSPQPNVGSTPLLYVHTWVLSSFSDSLHVCVQQVQFYVCTCTYVHAL